MEIVPGVWFLGPEAPTEDLEAQGVHLISLGISSSVPLFTTTSLSTVVPLLNAYGKRRHWLIESSFQEFIKKVLMLRPHLVPIPIREQAR